MRVLATAFTFLGLALAGAPVLLQQQQQAPSPSTPSVAAQVAADKETRTLEKPRIAYQKGIATAFRSSDRCIACHVGMKTSTGEDYSIGFDWRASLMANSSRDPYWQSSIRRETMEHPEAKQRIENECSFCHMAGIRLADRDAGRDTDVFAHFPFEKVDGKSSQMRRLAQDGVTCSVCHQIEKEGLGTDATYNGNVVVSKAVREDERPEYGPYDPDHGHQTLMHSSTAGYLPVHSDHMRDSALCASCHTLYTDPIAPASLKLARFPEQMPYKEWQHSDYEKKQTCQQCHMPEVKEPTPVTVLYGPMREGARRHVFVGADFVMDGILKDHREDLAVEALPEELDAANLRTRAFLQTQAAKVTIQHVDATAGKLSIDVLAQNLSGHKLPTAFPSRRAWLHLLVTDQQGNIVFESGKLRPNGSIVGNINDDDPSKFEPHFSEITNPGQVAIFEAILVDYQGKVTTGILAAARYGKDNRLLPAGFDKATADSDIEVVGNAARDPGFTDRGSSVHYLVPIGNAQGKLKIVAELWYQPIGYRWAHNLAPYQASEPQRMVKYFEVSAPDSAIVLAKAEAVR
jgi:mono/diheme cytochrome c family protein